MLVTWDVIKLVFEQLARLERRGEETWENRGGREEIIKERKKRKEKKRKERKKKRKQEEGERAKVRKRKKRGRLKDMMVVAGY